MSSLIDIIAEHFTPRKRCTKTSVKKEASADQGEETGEGEAEGGEDAAVKADPYVDSVDEEGLAMHLGGTPKPATPKPALQVPEQPAAKPQLQSAEDVQKEIDLLQLLVSWLYSMNCSGNGWLTVEWP